MSGKAKGWMVAVWPILLAGVAALVFLRTRSYMSLGLAVVGLGVGVFAWRVTQDIARGYAHIAAMHGTVVNAIFVFVLCVSLLGQVLLPRRGVPAEPMMCASNLHRLWKAMQAYARDSGTMSYPTPDKWCDLLIEGDYTTERLLTCKAAASRGDSSPCHYAVNPNCEPNSPLYIVLLFETTGGWNQFGGAELLSTENHGGDGCCIVLNDGSAMFQRTEELGKLRWKVEADAP